MLTLLSECHFWTMRDDVRIPNTDYGAFRYVRSRELQQWSPAEQFAFEAKREYHEQRQGVTVLKNNNRKGSQGRLKDNLKKLEELLRHHRVVHVHWSDAAQVLLLFANGIIAHLCIDVFTGDILRMVYEKYLVGKLAADTITDAFFTRTHIVLAYNTNQVTVVHLQKPNSRPQGPEKVANMEPKIFHALIPGTPERKLPRHLNVNGSGEMFVIWTKSSQNEVFPWRPTIRDQDRANIHVFKLKGIQLDFFSYCWSENDPLYVDFLRSVDNNQIITLEQKISRKGDVLAEICSYDVISVGKMNRGPLSTVVSVGTQITCFAFSPDQEKLFLGCIDRNICLHDLILQTTTKSTIQIDIVPTRCSWHCDSSIIVVANNRSQFQCFDLALTVIGQQLLGEEELVPLELLDLSHYFSSTAATAMTTNSSSTGSCPNNNNNSNSNSSNNNNNNNNNHNHSTNPYPSNTIITSNLCQISFSRKPELSQYYVQQKYAPTDCFLLLIYENGPLGCLRFPAAAGIRGDIHNSGLTTDVLLDQYLQLNQLEKAIQLLCALNWETYGAMCLISLHKIANYVFYSNDQRQREQDREQQQEQHRRNLQLMLKALQTFTDSLSEETKDEFSDQVFDLKRRFFFYLLRNESFNEAFEVAQDIEDYDLFMDLFNVTKSDRQLMELATSAFSQAASILHEEDRDNGNLSIAVDCHSGESSCSQSTTTISEGSTKIQDNSNSKSNSNQEKSPIKSKNYVPPTFPPPTSSTSNKSRILNAEMIKIVIPKPEVKAAQNPQKNSITTLNHHQNNSRRNNNNNSNTSSGKKKTTATTTTTIKSSSGNSKTVLKIPATTTKSLLHSTGSFRWKKGGDRGGERGGGGAGKRTTSTNINVSSSNSTKDVLDNGQTTTSVVVGGGAAGSLLVTRSSNPMNLHLPSPQPSSSSLVATGAGTATAAAAPGSSSSGASLMRSSRPYHHHSNLTSPPMMTSPPIISVLPLANNQMGVYQPKFFQHPLVSGHIPPTINNNNNNSNNINGNSNGNGYIGGLSLAAHSSSNEEYQKSLLSKKPTASILSNGGGGGGTLQNGHHYPHSNHHYPHSSHHYPSQLQSQQQQQMSREQTTLSGNGGQPSTFPSGTMMIINSTTTTTTTGNMKEKEKEKESSGGKSGTGEKNKVKFSDTVQVAVVPVGKHSNQEIPRKEKFPHMMLMKRNGYARPLTTLTTTLTNPKKELADSLPLCHPNDEYLKDFNPLPTLNHCLNTMINTSSSNSTFNMNGGSSGGVGGGGGGGGGRSNGDAGALF